MDFNCVIRVVAAPREAKGLETLDKCRRGSGNAELRQCAVQGHDARRLALDQGAKARHGDKPFLPWVDICEWTCAAQEAVKVYRLSGAPIEQ